MLTRSLRSRGFNHSACTILGEDGAGEGQEHLNQLQLHVLLRMVNAGLNEICLERKDPVPNDDSLESRGWVASPGKLASLLEASNEGCYGSWADVLWVKFGSELLSASHAAGIVTDVNSKDVIWYLKIAWKV